MAIRSLHSRKPLHRTASGHRHRSADAVRYVFLVVCSCACAVAWVPARALAGVPTPREKDDSKSGAPRPLDDLPKAERITKFPFDPGREYPEHLKFGSTWQEPRLCGPNALFVLLSLSGRQVDRDRVLGLVPITERGSTLADLSAAATKLGLNHRLKKVSQRELHGLTPPFLVHENIRSTSADEPDAGHYFVVVRIAENGQLYIVDGVSGTYQFTSPDRLDKSFSGYVLAPEVAVLGIPNRWIWGALYLLAAVVAVLAVTLAFLHLRLGDAVQLQPSI